MSQTARSGTGGIAVLGLAAVFALLADCYKPNVQSGGLLCATSSAKSCPDDFTCVGGVCVSSSSAPDASASTGGHGGAATGGRLGSGGQAGTGGLSGTGGVVGTGGMTGSGGSMPGQPRAVGETCAIVNAGAPDQSDNCVPGAVCSGDCAQNVCFPTCNSDDDCPTSSCTRTTTSGTKICEVSYTMCDPHASDGQQGCDVSRSCYLLSSTPAPGGGDRTVCDCTTGEQGVGAPCTDSRDCFPRLVCPVSTAPGGGFCRQACDPDIVAATGCPLLIACNRYGTNWGYCY